jgi:hypothetical protein
MDLSASLRRAAAPLKRAQAVWLFDRGVGAPPSQRAKQRHLLALMSERGHDMLIETGTYLGETTAYFASRARRVVSIEIEPALHARAARLFADAPSVEILLGDGMEIVPRLVGELESPCLIWLDGHFSGGITGRGELEEPAVEILRRIREQSPPRGMTIVVDDLRLFGSDPAAPGLAALVDAARETFPDAQLTAELDALVIRGAR